MKRSLLALPLLLSSLALLACGSGDDRVPPKTSKIAKQTVEAVNAACPEGARSYAPIATIDGTRYNVTDAVIVVCEDNTLKSVSFGEDANEQVVSAFTTQAVEACDTRDGVYAIAGLATVEGTRYNTTDALVVTCGDKSLHALQFG